MPAVKASALTSPSGWSGSNPTCRKLPEGRTRFSLDFREKVKSDRQRLKSKLSERKEAYKAFFADASDRRAAARGCIDRLCDRDRSQARLCGADAVSDRAEARTE